jgi:hypothetical protein
MPDHHHHHHDAPEVRARPVVLDLGEGIGALVVHTDPDLLGLEVEISPSDRDRDRQHKEVLQRAIGAGTATVLVYDGLPEGEYTLWVDDEPRTRGVRVNGGGVAELDWRGAGARDQRSDRERHELEALDVDEPAVRELERRDHG